MTLYPLYSTSKGNCTLLKQAERGIIIDCGVSCAQIGRALAAAGLGWEQIDGVLLTHEHIDHIRAVPQVGKKNLRFYGSAGTLAAAGADGEAVREGEPFSVGAFTVTPIAVSHDAAEPFGYRVETENGALAIVTDTGTTTPDMLRLLSGCRLIMLESNYDPQMLENGPYSAALKKRIRSARGHLSNEECGQLLALKTMEGAVKTAVLAHLSDHNNTPLTARQAILTVFEQYGVAPPRLEIGGPFCPPVEV